MKRIAAGMMFAALAVVPVLCAQTFTNVVASVTFKTCYRDW